MSSVSCYARFGPGYVVWSGVRGDVRGTRLWDCPGFVLCVLETIIFNNPLLNPGHPLLNPGHPSVGALLIVDETITLTNASSVSFRVAPFFSVPNPVLTFIRGRLVAELS